MGFYAHTADTTVCLNFFYGSKTGTDHLLAVPNKDIYKANGKPYMRGGKPVWQPYIAPTVAELQAAMCKAWKMEKFNQFTQYTISEKV